MCLKESFFKISSTDISGNAGAAVVSSEKDISGSAAMSSKAPMKDLIFFIVSIPCVSSYDSIQRESIHIHGLAEYGKADIVDYPYLSRDVLSVHVRQTDTQHHQRFHVPVFAQDFKF